MQRSDGIASVLIETKPYNRPPVREFKFLKPNIYLHGTWSETMDLVLSLRYFDEWLREDDEILPL